MNGSTARQGRSCAGTCRFLRRHFKGLYMNFSHDTQDCWAASNAGLVPTHKPRYIDTHGFWKAGSRAKDGSVITATGRRWKPEDHLPRKRAGANATARAHEHARTA